MALHDNYNGYYVNYQEPPSVYNFSRDSFRRFYPHLEQVMVWREVGENVPSGGGVPWWVNPGFAHYGHNGHLNNVVEEPVCNERERVDYEEQTMSMELYVPLCCDHCENRVTQYLIDSPGVESVTPSQWEKKVVVMGRNLRPHDLLQSLQRHLNMPRASFWENRPCY